MSKKILAIYYTQTGQLEEIIDSFITPFMDAGVSVEKLRIRTKVNYPFPWNGRRFFEMMPDSVLGIPTTLEPFEMKEKAYDLIIFGYQAWFLSPSIPSNSILANPAFRIVLKNTPVITITGARNMWLSAMERVKKLLQQADAKLVGNIALVDRHHNLVSFVTLLRWMFKGKKDRYLNIFPPPGVAVEDIVHTQVFGKTALHYLNKSEWAGTQAELVQQGAVEVKYNLMFIESKARRIFSLWARFIAKRKKRTGWLVVFKYYLLIALFIAAPLILTIDALFFKPFLSRRIKRQKQYYSDVN